MKLEDRIMEYLKECNGQYSHQEISDVLEAKRPSVSKALKKLEEKKLIIQEEMRIGRSTKKLVSLIDYNIGEPEHSTRLNSSYDNIHGEKERENIHREITKIKSISELENKKNINQPFRKVPTAKEYSGLDYYQLDMEQLRMVYRLLTGRVDKSKGGKASNLMSIIPAIIEGLEFNLMHHNKNGHL